MEISHAVLYRHTSVFHFASLFAMMERAAIRRIISKNETVLSILSRIERISGPDCCALLIAERSRDPSRKKGQFELADKGTIFLDGVDDFPIEFQPKLLRVLESREVQRIGGQKPIPLDIRFFFAPTLDLSEKVAQGKFQMDLLNASMSSRSSFPRCGNARKMSPCWRSNS